MLMISKKKGLAVIRQGFGLKKGPTEVQSGRVDHPILPKDRLNPRYFYKPQAWRAWILA
jgi:hypothetical protein